MPECRGVGVWPVPGVRGDAGEEGLLLAQRTAAGLVVLFAGVCRVDPAGAYLRAGGAQHWGGAVRAATIGLVSNMTPGELRAWVSMAQDGTLSRYAKTTGPGGSLNVPDREYELALAKRMARLDCAAALAELRARS